MDKPTLRLTKKELLKYSETGLISKELQENFLRDIKTSLEFMIANEKKLNINLDRYEGSHKCKTFRCVAGWMSFWYGIKIRKGENARITTTTYEFESIFGNNYGLTEKISIRLNNIDKNDKIEEWLWQALFSEKEENLTIIESLKNRLAFLNDILEKEYKK